MKLRRLEISHFRGIEKLTWDPAPGFNLLIGPGDSGKTTILDAVDFVLGPRWNLSFADTDFCGCDLTRPIEITATLGELPLKIKQDPKYETHYRGWRKGAIHDEPLDDDTGQDELVLSIRLAVGADLEPAWFVWTQREPESRPPLRAVDREILGMVRVGAYVDRHLTWGRGSALHQFSGDIDELGPIFAQARREVQDSFNKQELPRLREITQKLDSKAKDLGVRITDDLRPGLEMTALQSSSAAIGLFDGNVPTRQMGLGSRRLLTTTMQLERAADKSLLLVDELESALEPHRVRKLVRTLTANPVQVIASTHSAIAVQESCKQTVHYVTCEDGATAIRPFGSLIRKNLEKTPYAALAAKVIICEGRTEEGFLDACLSRWQEMGSNDLDGLGVVEAYGEGSPNAGKLAMAYAEMGVSTAFYGDSDRGVGFTRESADKVGLSCYQYREGWHAERAFFESLTDEQVADFIEFLSSQDRFSHLREILGEFFIMPEDNNLLWTPNVEPLPSYATMREALAAAAAGRPQDKTDSSKLWWKEWFKDRALARQALEPVVTDWKAFQTTELGKALEGLRIWCYEQ